MRTTRWSAVPVVLLLLLSPRSPAPYPVLPENTDDGAVVSADAEGDHVAVGETRQSVLGPEGSGAGGSGGVGESVSGGGGVPVCGVTGVTVMLPMGDRAEYRLCRRVEPVVSVGGVPVVVSVSDVSTLLVEGSGLVRQPPGDMVIVPKDLIVYTDPSSRTLTALAGGTPVSVAVSLTTSWSATFSVDGGPPQPVSGTVTTTETSAPFDLVCLVGVLTDDAEEAQGH